jgi:hypothetical protein
VIAALRCYLALAAITSAPGALEQSHVGAVLAAAQDRAQRNHQDLVQVVAPGIAGAGILQIRMDRPKSVPQRTPDPIETAA